MTEKNIGMSPELDKPKSRNSIIKEAIAEGKTPMLAFEQRQFEVELLGHSATQSELSALLGEAMTTTSETWHDNAQADAVTMQSHILESQAKDVIAALKSRFIIPYEQDEQDKVSIGALVDVLIGQSPQTIFMTGKQRRLPGDIAEILGEDTTAANVQSPIGAAIFDQSVGAVASYKVGERQLQVTVVSIQYPDIKPADK